MSKGYIIPRRHWVELWPPDSSLQDNTRHCHQS